MPISSPAAPAAVPTFADAAARTSASGFVAADVGRLYVQLDNATLWRLTATTPTWQQVAPSSVHDVVLAETTSSAFTAGYYSTAELATFTAIASAGSTSPTLAYDNNTGTHWNSQNVQTAGVWLGMDFGTAVPLDQLTITQSSGDTAAQLAVEYSSTGQWAGEQAAATGTVSIGGGVTVVTFTSVFTARYWRVKPVNGISNGFWRITELAWRKGVTLIVAGLSAGMAVKTYTAGNTLLEHKRLLAVNLGYVMVSTTNVAKFEVFAPDGTTLVATKTGTFANGNLYTFV